MSSTKRGRGLGLLWSGLGQVRRLLARKGRILAHGVDLGLVLAVVVGLFAASPFLARAGLPHQTDAELHVYRTAELHHLTGEGVAYPRWGAHLYLGYGYPIFNYYAPLTYHLGSLFATVLPSVGPVLAVKLVFVLGLTLASVGAYLLGRELFEPAGGLLAAATFALSPYVLFIDTYARGDLAEHFAVCLLPLSFYFVHRLIRAPGPGVLLGSVLALSAVVFSHNLLGLAGSVLLLGYWAWSSLLERRGWKTLWALIAFAVAAGLIAFFWLPALLERDAVKLEVIGPGHFDYREHFLTMGELLAPARLIDWGAVGPRFRHNLGVPQWVLALPAVAVVMDCCRGPAHKRRAWDVGFFLVGALALVVLMLPVSAPAWRLVPAMPYLQFPWRLLGPANLCLAACAASVPTLLSSGRWRRLVLAGAVVLAVTMALPLLYPTPWDEEFGGISPADIIRWERYSQALGTTSTGDFLPTTVEMIPSIAPTLLRSVEGGGPIDKVNRATLPEGSEVILLDRGPRHDRFLVTTPVPFVLRLYTFDFPGWTAYIDDREVEIEIARPEGFITVPVPEGAHRVLVRFEDTFARTLGWAISAGAVLVLSALVGAWRVKGRDNEADPPSNLSLSDGAAIGGALALIILAKAAVIDPQGWLRLNSPPGHAVPAANKLQERAARSFDGKIELLGYDVSKRRVKAGQTFSVVLYWRALTDLEKNYQSFVHLAQPLDTVWGQEDHLNPGGLPTGRWPTDKYVWDAYEISVGPETPPGEYSLNVGLYSILDGYRLDLLDQGGSPIGDSLVVSSITVTD